MAEPNLASSSTSVQQKGTNAQKVKAYYCIDNDRYCNQWQTDNKCSTRLFFLLVANYLDLYY